MHSRPDRVPVERARWACLQDVLALQCGIILRRQAFAAGVARSRLDHWIRSGRWVRVLPGVYAVGVDPRGAGARIWAAWLWAGPDAVIGGGAAAFWHEVTTGMPPQVLVFVPPGRSRTAVPGVDLVRGRVPAPDRQRLRGISVTTVPRTCLDLARRGAVDHLDFALRRGRLTIDQLPLSVARSRYRRGQVRARRVVADVRGNPWSRPERMLHALLRDAGITGWVANRREQSAGGAAYPDVGFEDIKLAVELDGRRFHDEAADPAAFEDDHRRQLELAHAGWFVIRVTVRQLIEEPEAVLAAVRATVAKLRTERAGH